MKSLEDVKDFIEASLSNRVIDSFVLDGVSNFSCAYQFIVGNIVLFSDLMNLSNFCNSKYICVSPSISNRSLTLTIYFDE